MVVEMRLGLVQRGLQKFKEKKDLEIARRQRVQREGPVMNLFNVIKLLYILKKLWITISKHIFSYFSSSFSL